MNTLVFKSHYSDNVSILQASLLLRDEIHSNPFIDAVIHSCNSLSYKGLFF